MNHLSERLKSLRTETGLTQKEFASKLLISQSYLNALENGIKHPPERIVKLICLEFNIREEWLLEGRGEKYKISHEHEKYRLTEMSNDALFKMMNALQTESIDKYEYYASFFNHSASIIDLVDNINSEESRLIILKHLQSFIINLHNAFICSQDLYKNTRTGQRNLLDESANAKASKEDLERLLRYIENRE